MICVRKRVATMGIISKLHPSIHPTTHPSIILYHQPSVHSESIIHSLSIICDPCFFCQPSMIIYHPIIHSQSSVCSTFFHLSIIYTSIHPSNLPFSLFPVQSDFDWNVDAMVIGHLVMMSQMISLMSQRCCSWRPVPFVDGFFFTHRLQKTHSDQSLDTVIHSHTLWRPVYQPISMSVRSGQSRS